MRIDFKGELPPDIQKALEQVTEYVLTTTATDFWENCVWEEEIRPANPREGRNLKDAHVYNYAARLRRWLHGQNEWQRNQHPWPYGYVPSPTVQLPSTTSSDPTEDVP